MEVKTEMRPANYNTIKKREKGSNLRTVGNRRTKRRSQAIKHQDLSHFRDLESTTKLPRIDCWETTIEMGAPKVLAPRFKFLKDPRGATMGFMTKPWYKS